MTIRDLSAYLNSILESGLADAEQSVYIKVSKTDTYERAQSVSWYDDRTVYIVTEEEGE